MLLEYLRNCTADKKSTALVAVGVPKVDARRASVSTRVACLTGPQRKSPMYAPVVDWTLGTPPVRSISFTVIAGDSEGLKIAISLSFELYDKN
jgi:hypothetical protein